MSRVLARIVTEDDDEIVVEWVAGVIVLTINQGQSEPGEMPTFEVELTKDEAIHLAGVLDPD